MTEVQESRGRKGGGQVIAVIEGARVDNTGGVSWQGSKGTHRWSKHFSQLPPPLPLLFPRRVVPSVFLAPATLVQLVEGRLNVLHTS